MQAIIMTEARRGPASFPSSFPTQPSHIASESSHTAAVICQPASALRLEPCTPGCSRTTWRWGGPLVGLTIQLGSRLHLERHQSRGSPGSPALTTLAHRSPGLHSFSPSLPSSFPLPCAQHGP